MFNLQRESYRRKEASWLKNEDKIEVERYDCPGTYIEVKAQPFEKLVELCTRQESHALQIVINQQIIQPEAFTKRSQIAHAVFIALHQ